MAEEPFMLVSLEEAKSKKLAQVLSNDTATKILSLLTKGKATESDIAKKLNIPISTIHYNLKQLVEAKLVTTREFHYSTKGREVLHYQLANKYIIIAPQEERESFLQKLKGLLPATIIALGVGIALHFFSRENTTTNIIPYAAPMARGALQDSMEMAAVPVEESAKIMVEETTKWWLTSEFAFGIIAGAILLVALIITINLIKKK